MLQTCTDFIRIETTQNGNEQREFFYMKVWHVVCDAHYVLRRQMLTLIMFAYSLQKLFKHNHDAPYDLYNVCSYR